MDLEMARQDELRAVVDLEMAGQDTLSWTWAACLVHRCQDPGEGIRDHGCVASDCDLFE